MADMVVYNEDNTAITNNWNYGDGYFCTVDITTEEGQNIAIMAFNGATPLTEVGDKPFMMYDFIQENGVRAVSGDPCINTYIVSDDNKVYFTQSAGIANSVQQFAKFKSHIFSGGGGAKVKVGKRDTARGTMKYLIPA